MLSLARFLLIKVSSYYEDLKVKTYNKYITSFYNFTKVNIQRKFKALKSSIYLSRIRLINTIVSYIKIRKERELRIAQLHASGSSRH